MNMSNVWLDLHGWKVCGVLLVWFLVLCMLPWYSKAADITFSVTLNDTQQIALTYATEQENARRVLLLLGNIP